MGGVRENGAFEGERERIGPERSEREREWGVRGVKESGV